MVRWPSLVLFLAYSLQASAGGAKVTVVHESECATNAYVNLGCQGAAEARAKFSDDNITLQLVPSLECSTWVQSGSHPYDVIVFIGFLFDACSLEAAAAHPNTWVTIIDSCPEGKEEYPNFICASFAEDQPAYVAGYLAGLVSKTQTTGIVGGAPVPAVQKLFNGFLLGVQASCPACKVEGMFIQSFFHPGNAVAVADYLVDDMGADVVFGCGGGTGTEAIKRASEKGSMVIGVDVDEFESTFAGLPDAQRKLVITSALKKVNVAAVTLIALLKDFAMGAPQVMELNGLLRFDYANKGVAIADCHQGCEVVGHGNWVQAERVENRLASNEISVGLVGWGWDVQLLPASAETNTFFTAPNSATPPAPRMQAAMGVLTAFLVDFIVAFGGRSETGQFFNDLWLYNRQAGNWLNANHGFTHGTPPPALTKSCVVTSDLSVLIFGGRQTDGEQSLETYSFTYQPTFIGFGDPTSSLIHHQWSHLHADGEMPFAVEGPACTQFSDGCGITFGGRAKLGDRDTLHTFCINGGNVTWKQLVPTSQLKPFARENAGIAKLDASLVGSGTGDSLIMVGGISSLGGAVAFADAWVFNLTELTWSKLPDLPQGLTNPLVFEALGEDGISKVLAVHSTAVLEAGSGFGAFTFDSQRQLWNVQDTSFQGVNSADLNKVSMVSGSGHLWMFGGTESQTYLNRMMLSTFIVKTICSAGYFSVGVGCEACGPGNVSAGGVGATCTPCQPGKFAKLNGTSECSVCGAGLFTGQAGMSECALCNAGKYKVAGIGPCVDCPYGTYGPQSGAGTVNECSQCAPGRYTGNTSGASSIDDCIACEVGRALKVAFGQNECSKCQAGTFNKDLGATECVACPVGEWQSVVGATGCKKCASLLTTKYFGTPSETECICAGNSYKPETQDGQACLPCPGGMTCPVGSEARYLLAGGGPSPLLKEGFMSRLANPLLVYKCGLTQHCPGGRPGVCAENMDPDKVACAWCMEDTFESENKCKPCAGGGPNALPLIAVIIVGICLVCGITLAVNRNLLMQTNSTVIIVVLMGIMFTSIQTLGVFDQLLVEWFEPVGSILRVMSLLSFDLKLLKLDCIAEVNVVTRYLGRQFIAPLVLPLAAGTLIVKKMFRPSTHVGVEFLNSVGTIFNTFFISIVVSSVTPLICYEHPEPTQLSSMINAPSVLCFKGGDHTSMVLIGVLAFCLVPLPFLCAALYLTRIYPACIHGSVSNSDLKLMASRFFFFRFKPERYYYGCIMLARSLSLCIVPVCIQNDMGLQICIMVMFICGFSVVQQQLGPWRNNITNVMDAVLGMFLVLLLVCGSVGQNLDNGATSAIKVVGTCCFILSVGAGLSVLGYAILIRLIPNPFYHRFICHHKQGAAAQARFLKMSLSAHTGGSVFIDSDDLKELGTLFNIVRSNIGQLIVYLTRDTLSRPWCAGEIVTGLASSQVKVVTVRTPSFEDPERHRIDAIARNVELADCTLQEYGISSDDVVKAYEKLLGSDTPTYAFDSQIHGTMRFDRLVESILEKKNSTSGAAFELPNSSGMVVVSADPGQDESCAAAGILIAKIKQDVLAKAAEGICCVADYNYAPVALAPLVAGARAVIVILTEGSMYCPSQLHCIVEAMGGSTEKRPSRSTMEEVARVIPVSTPDFKFPTEQYYSTYLPKMISSTDSADVTIELIHAFFKYISVSFATHASDKVIDTQCAAVLARIPENFNTDMAKKKSEIARKKSDLTIDKSDAFLVIQQDAKNFMLDQRDSSASILEDAKLSILDQRDSTASIRLWL